MAIQLAQLCVTALSSTPRTRVSVPLTAMNLFSSIIFIYLSDFEHRMSQKPSDILSIFLFVSICLEITRIHSLWVIDGTLAVAILLATINIVKFAILILESWSKRGALTKPYADCSPEALSGILSHLSFLWLNPLMWLGYKNSLTLDMLFELDPKIRSGKVSERTISDWKRCKSNSSSVAKWLISWYKYSESEEATCVAVLSLFD